MDDPSALTNGDSINCDEIIKLFTFEREKLRIAEEAMVKVQHEESETLCRKVARTVKHLANVLVDKKKCDRGSVLGHFDTFVRETEKTIVWIVEEYVGQIRRLEENVNHVWRRTEERMLEMERLCREDVASSTCGSACSSRSPSPTRSVKGGRQERKLLSVSSFGRIKKRTCVSKVAFTRWTPHHKFTFSSLMPHLKCSVKGRRCCSRDRKQRKHSALNGTEAVRQFSSNESWVSCENNSSKHSGESFVSGSTVILSKPCSAVRNQQVLVCGNVSVAEKSYARRQSVDSIASRSNSINSKTSIANVSVTEKRNVRRQSNDSIASSSNSINSKTYKTKPAKPFKPVVRPNSARTSKESLASSGSTKSSRTTTINSKTYIIRPKKENSTPYLAVSGKESVTSVNTYIIGSCSNPKRNLPKPEGASSSEAPQKRAGLLTSVATSFQNANGNQSPACDRRQFRKTTTNSTVRVCKPLPFGPKNLALKLPRVKSNGAWGLAWHQKLSEGKELNLSDRIAKREYAMSKLRASFRVFGDTVQLWERWAKEYGGDGRGSQQVAPLRAVSVPEMSPRSHATRVASATERDSPLKMFFRGATLKMYPRWAWPGVVS